MHSGSKTLLVALLLMCGCHQNDVSRWNPISRAIEEYVAGNHGQMMSNRPSCSSPSPSFRCWTIVIPIDDLTIAKVDMLADGLSAALTRVDSSLAGSGSSSADPTVTESEPGKFAWSSGPALVRELYREGKGGRFRIIARGLTRDANGLSGYRQATEKEPPLQGKQIVLLEAIVTKAK